jgi:transcriptional regulator of arginine metabolism
MNTYSVGMQVDRRSLAKGERQRLIASLVTRKRFGTQRELLEALDREGCPVTQATVSRDIRELGLQKVRDSLGHARFVLPQRGARSDPRDALASILASFGHRATAAENVVVIQSELGSAPAIGRALDRLEHPRIVGTLAGDDTCLAIAPTAREARAVAAELTELIG